MLRYLLLFLFVPAVATALVLPDKLLQDFAPLDGIVVLATPGQVLIDRDGASGVAVGDLFAIVTPGAPIIHPTSGAVLGVNQSIGNWLRVASVRSGYSETTLLAAAPPATVGAKVSRFVEAEALLLDAAGTTGELYSQLQAALPQLRWLGYFTKNSQLPVATSSPRLIFSTAGNQLEVREERSGLLRRYPLPTPASAPLAAIPAPAVLMPQAVTMPVTQGSYWSGPVVKGEGRGVEIADLDGDGRTETITVSLHGIEIGRFTGKEYQKLAELNLGFSSSLLSVDAFDSDSNGKLELWVTAHREGELDSMVLLWDGQRTITKAAEGLNWWLRAMTLPEGDRILFAQQMGMGESDFSGPIVTIALKNGKIVTTPTALPEQQSLYGFARLSSKEGPLAVQLTPYDKLIVRAENGERLHEGEESYGGSEAFIPRFDPMRGGRDPEIRHVYPAPRFEVIGKRYLLAPANIGSRTFARQRLFKESRLDLLEWDGAQLRPIITGRVEKGYLADYRYADIDNDGTKELASLLVTARPSFGGTGRYQIVVNETVLPE